MSGILFVVATPIGNLEDLSFRALRTLKEVDVIAAEDTRRTAKLLAHYEVRKPMVSLHAHNEHREGPRLIARLERGESVALVTDAGTPGISDPGAHLVQLARERQVKVSPIPGPTAVMAALSVSGFPADQFVFMGFPPRSGSARRAWLDRIRLEPSPIVIFEAPHRIDRTLAELSELAKRPIQFHRELTKINEELVNHTRQAPGVKALGEFVIVLGPLNSEKQREPVDTQSLSKSIAMVGCITTNCQYERQEAIALASKAYGLDENLVRKAVKQHRIAENRRRQSLS